MLCWRGAPAPTWQLFIPTDWSRGREDTFACCANGGRRGGGTRQRGIYGIISIISTAGISWIWTRQGPQLMILWAWRWGILACGGGGRTNGAGFCIRRGGGEWLSLIGGGCKYVTLTALFSFWTIIVNTLFWTILLFLLFIVNTLIWTISFRRFIFC